MAGIYLQTKAALARVVVNKKTFEKGVHRSNITKLDQWGLVAWVDIDGKQWIDVEETVQRSGIIVDLEPEKPIKAPERVIGTERYKFIASDEEWDVTSQETMVNTLIDVLDSFETGSFTKEDALEVMTESLKDYCLDIEQNPKWVEEK